MYKFPIDVIVLTTQRVENCTKIFFKSPLIIFSIMLIIVNIAFAMPYTSFRLLKSVIKLFEDILLYFIAQGCH